MVGRGGHRQKRGDLVGCIGIFLNSWAPLIDELPVPVLTSLGHRRGLVAAVAQCSLFVPFVSWLFQILL